MNSLSVYFTFIIVVISAASTILLISAAFPAHNYAYGQVGNLPATYAVEIVPGASNRTNAIHYYPPAIAVPLGTTVAWFNNDPEQPHTVTSGLPGASDSGAIFNSGLMPATINTFFQYTFNKAGNFPYHCEIHPWRVAIVSVGAGREKGNNFEFFAGAGPTWNLTKDFRTLLDFTPLTITLDQITPITYNVTIFKNNTTDKVFSKTFTVPGDKLPLELVSGGYANETRAYGPDFSSSGAYHLQAPFFKGDENYILRIQIAAINGVQPQNKITDDFSLRTVT
jgi:plastocyanin